MKTTANAVRDVSHTIIESELVLNLLRGHNPSFSSTADNIADSTPLPNFTTAREKLVLKELRLANECRSLPRPPSSQALPPAAPPAKRPWVARAPLAAAAG